LEKLPTDKPSYFEIGIVNGGNTNRISVGISLKTTKTNRAPGWDVDTIGYWGNGKGRIYHGNPRAVVEEASGFKSGDIVGCAIEPIKIGKRTIYTFQFSKNGENVGTERILTNSELYPTVSLYSKNAQVITNFGNKRLEWKGSLTKGNYLITLK
jgi:hypothetical protein